ncbi:MAG: hypothetical protein EP330_11725 [Deltaproteobacteria bacterium]|nr:MAG: hypothetical protein EP330_11725 [Deltaproteobacteria bacterium]
MERVDPPVGYIGSETVIQIYGQHFLPAVGVDATGADPDFDADFDIRLVRPADEGEAFDESLPGAVLRSYENLEAVVPAGLDPGTYDVIVTGPTGASGRLINGFTASATQADHLALDSDLIVYEVREEAQIRIELQDRDGNRVFADEQVVVYVEAEDGEASPVFTNGSLNDQLPVGDLAIQGSLGPDGAATIGLTSTTPDQLTVVVTPSSTSSPLADGQLVVLFEPGDDISARLELPSTDFRATAGEPFPLQVVLVDQFGNEAPEASTSIVLRSSCSAWVEVVDVIGRATVSPTVTQATAPQTSCESEQIVSASGASGSSATFLVDPGPAARFDVVATPDTLTAGETPMQVVATPTDAFGNRAAWTGTPVIDDTVGGIGAFTCNVDELVVCDASPQVAGSGIRLTVDGQDGVTGTSDPYEVLPGAPTTLGIEVLSAPIIADNRAIVRLSVRDAFGNLVPGSAFATTAFAFFKDGVPIGCTELVSPDDRILYGCAIRDAAPAVVVRAELAGFSLSATAPPVQVINGVLATATVGVDRNAITAGESVGLDVRAFDAWGNPYVVQSDPVLTVTDALGGFGGTALTLDGAGVAAGSVAPTVAGVTQIDVSQGQTLLGSSVPITVDAAGPAELDLALADPWVWTTIPVPIAVRAIDAFGNPAVADGVVTLNSASGSATSSSLPLVAGEGIGTLTWSAPQFDERVVASGVGLTGALDGLLVVEDCGTGGPTAALDVATRTCGTAQTGDVTADLSGSTGGVTVVGLASDVGVAQGAPGLLTVPLSGWGPHDLTGLAVASDGCGAEIAATTWLGPDDGSVVGPVTLTADLQPLEAGVDRAVLTLSDARTCDGTPANGAAVRLRSDRGELGQLSALGDGLFATIDSSGASGASLDAATIVEGPTATVRANVDSGAVAGSLAIPITGDLLAPTLFSASPAGDTTGSVDTAILTFSEALDPGTVATSAFSLTGPSQARVQFATLQADGRTVELRLQSAVNADAGLWTLTVSPALTDLAGNPLDGGFDGGSSPLIVRFGASTPAVSAVSCTADVSRFRPDGDDGVGEQADQVTLVPSSASTPDTWMLSVYASDAALVRRERVDGASPSLTWDGRDQSGKIVDDGDWTVEIDARDTEDNLGGACSVTVTLANGEAP